MATQEVGVSKDDSAAEGGVSYQAFPSNAQKREPTMAEPGLIVVIHQPVRETRGEDGL
jgi:hypothetical protein